MKRLVLALALVAAPIAAQPLNRSAPIVVQLDGVPTASLVTRLLEMTKAPYVIAPEVLADRKPTSVNLVIPRHQLQQRVLAYLRAIGLGVIVQDGTVYVGRSGFGGGRTQRVDYAPGYGPGSSVPMGSPVDLGRDDMPVARPRQLVGTGTRPESASDVSDNSIPVSHGAPTQPDTQEAGSLLGYIPAHREPSYLAAIVGPLIPGLVFGARADQTTDQGNNRALPIQGPDVLVFSGPPSDLERAKRLIAMLDRPRPMVSVKAVVLQASTTQSRGSALNVLLRLGGGKASAGSFPAIAPTGAQFVRLATGAVQAILSAASEDSRFRVVATPNLAALSGDVSTMNSGSQVPTVGQLSLTESGQPLQSVVYRDSGISLQVRPIVRGNLVELAVSQERSTFIATTTGVDDSPTLQKSSASASVTLLSGESVVLAGLTEASSGKSREGLLGGLLGVRSREKSDSELLVVLTAEIIPTPPTPPGRFVDLEGITEENGVVAPTDPLAALS